MNKISVEFGPTFKVNISPAAVALTLPMQCLVSNPDSASGILPGEALQLDDLLYRIGSADEFLLLARISVAEGFDVATHRLYSNLLQACGKAGLYRIWNFVPRINLYADRLENYRSFCIGRLRAFADTGITNYPAASAVGARGSELCVVARGGSAQISRYENPQQIPAFEYPVLHGPSSPSFCRATKVFKWGERQRFYISGTASILGHHSVGKGDLQRQLDVTFDNLNVLFQQMGLNLQHSLAAADTRMRIYLRDAENLQFLQLYLMTRFSPELRPEILLAEICRRELDVEVELEGDYG